METNEKTAYIYGDGIGRVTLLSTMGDQYTPAEDARTSTNKGRLGPEKDLALQERLVKDGHTSPFEGVLVKAEFVVPLFVLREIDRHRTLSKVSDVDTLDLVSPEEDGRKWFARNEMSGRYVQLPNEYYFPADVRGQSVSNKQGGTGDCPPIAKETQDEFVRRGSELTREARELYDWAVQAGVEKGLARIFNTVNQYTKIRMTGSLKNWCDFLKLRLPGVVLWECRRVAEELERLLVAEFPDAMRSWRRNVYETVTLTAAEARALLAERVDSQPYDDVFFRSAFEKLRRLA